MFKDYIYLNTSKIKNYGIKLGLNDELLKKEETNIAEEMYFEEFENKLELEHINKDFIDLDEDDEFGVSNIKKQMIVRFEKNLSIPDKFGQVEFIEKVLANKSIKEYLFKSMTNESDMPEEFMNKLIRNKGKIPIYFDEGDYKLYSNLEGKYLRNIEYIDFEEYIGESVTVVAKVESKSDNLKEITLYNIYKNLLGLNREMRRSMNCDNSSGMPEEIKIIGKGIKIEILGIYK